MVEKALHGVDMQRDENCSTSVGPFPYAGGNLVCMGQLVARQLASDPNFEAFVNKAHERNDHGVKCTSPLECAGQPWDIHMWHHEDAGISYNLFRSVVRSGLTGIKVVKIQPWIHIQHWLRNNVSIPFPFVVIHQLKDIKQLSLVMDQWHTGPGDWEREDEKITCETCKAMHGWTWSRACCSGEGDTCDSFCSLDPNAIYECCTKTWPKHVMQRLKDDEKRVAELDRLKRKQWEAKKALEKEARLKAEKERIDARSRAVVAQRMQVEVDARVNGTSTALANANANANAAQMAGAGAPGSARRS